MNSSDCRVILSVLGYCVSIHATAADLKSEAVLLFTLHTSLISKFSRNEHLEVTVFLTSLCRVLVAS